MCSLVYCGRHHKHKSDMDEDKRDCIEQIKTLQTMLSVCISEFRRLLLKLQYHQSNNEDELAQECQEELDAVDNIMSAFKAKLERKTLEAEEHAAK